MNQALRILKKSSTNGGIIGFNGSRSFLLNNNGWKSISITKNNRFYSTNTNNSNKVEDLTLADNVITTPVTNAETIISNVGESSTKIIPSYITNPTTLPEGSAITEWFHQFNFDIIAVFNDIHIQYGIPWIGVIAGTAVALRLLTLPVSIKTQKTAVIMKKVKEEVEKHSYLNDGTNEGRIKVMQLQNQIMKKHNISTMSTIAPNLLQLPFILYPFVLLRQLCADTNLLHSAGFLWFKDLSALDPFYILPIISSGFQYLSVRFSMADDAPPVMKYMMTGLCFVPLIFTIKFAAGLNIYWAINSIIFAATNYFLKTKRGAGLFGIPYTEKVEKIKIAPDTFTMVKNAANTNSNTTNTTSSNANSEIVNRKLKEIEEKREIIEKKKQELKTFGRRK